MQSTPSLMLERVLNWPLVDVMWKINKNAQILNICICKPNECLQVLTDFYGHVSNALEKKKLQRKGTANFFRRANPLKIISFIFLFFFLKFCLFRSRTEYTTKKQTRLKVIFGVIGDILEFLENVLTVAFLSFLWTPFQISPWDIV